MLKILLHSFIRKLQLFKQKSSSNARDIPDGVPDSKLRQQG